MAGACDWEPWLLTSNDQRLEEIEEDIYDLYIIWRTTPNVIVDIGTTIPGGMTPDGDISAYVQSSVRFR